MSIQLTDQMSPRESLQHEWAAQDWEKQAEHAMNMKRLELEIKREDNQAKIELKKLESKWASWLKLPSLIIRLPLLIVLGVAYIVAVIKKQEPPKSFWNLLD